ncbi:MAG: 1-(5-phosphoribosyl)-5-[(5-phosphoribosylamino)methylideneamino]imidazole-4-carboxamide isomerase [Halobacteria archaeon]
MSDGKGGEEEDVEERFDQIDQFYKGDDDWYRVDDDYLDELIDENRFEVVPAVDMKDGECVQLVQGEEGTGKTYGDPVEAAEKWIREGAETIHLVDLNGAIDGDRRNAETIREITEATDVEIQVGGGIRSVDAARKLFDSGVDRVIVGTKAVEEPEFVEEVSRHGEVMVSLDAREGEVLVEGWKEGSGISPIELATKFEDLGARSILFTNVDDEGLLDGVDPEPVRKISEKVSVPVVASGGVSKPTDVEKLYHGGASAVVVGTALYEGEVSLPELQEAVGGSG